MVWSFDILSAAIGAIITFIVMLIIMVFLYAWVAKEAYMQGHRDARKGKWIGDKDKAVSS